MEPDQEAKEEMNVGHVEDGVDGRSDGVVYTDAEARLVKKKLDLILLPLLCGCYIMSVSILASSPEPPALIA
jgi:hypothetical protein